MTNKSKSGLALAIALALATGAGSAMADDKGRGKSDDKGKGGIAACKVLASAIGTGVRGIVLPSVERANFGAVASICRMHAECHAAYGIHPLYVDRAQEQDLDALRLMLANEPAVAVGEIGLDRFVEPRNDARQLHFFVEQLRIAREFDLPVVLHVRRAVDAVLKELRRSRLRGGIAHAFNGSRQQANEFVKLGFKLGFGGAMTFPRALRIRDVLQPDAAPLGAYGNPRLWVEAQGE